MKSPLSLALILLVTSLLLGGCWNMKEAKDPYVPVQEYTGQGYRLPNGDVTDKIAEAHRKEVIDATKKFFLDKYKTKVKVHNIVGNKDGATVFVESIGEPHFHTYAIVPIDVRHEKILTDEVWSQEGRIEQAIQSGFYRMMNNNRFDQLDHYLERLVEKYDITGKTIKDIDNTGSVGYMTPYYYVDASGNALKKIYKEYITNPKMERKQLFDFYQPKEINPDDILITIQLFMKEKEAEPNEKLFDLICKNIKEFTWLPKGSYNILLNDNRIDKSSGSGVKGNSLDRGYPNSIVKR